MDREEPLAAAALSTTTSSASTTDQRSDDELFLATLQGEYEDDAPWSAVTELRRRNTEAVFHLAVGFCESQAPLRRARGLDVLAQLGAGLPNEDRLHFDDAVDLAIAHLSDGDSTVVNSAAWALSHLRNDRAVKALIQVRNNTDPDVRWAVACGMAGSERPEAIETLKQLMEDANQDVRNWATFGLGSQCAVDSPDIR
jgi:HEAT repeat protein